MLLRVVLSRDVREFIPLDTWVPQACDAADYEDDDNPGGSPHEDPNLRRRVLEGEQ